MILEGERLGWVDAVKGVAIIAVVVSHIGPFYEFIPLRNYIMVTLPAFFFVSGYLLNWNKYQKNARRFIRRRAKLLMLPVYVTGVFALLFQYFYWIGTGQVLAHKFWTHDPLTVLIQMLQVDLGYYSWFHSVWFLSALFTCEMVFFCILHFIQSDEYRILAACLLAAPALLVYNQYTPFFIAPALAALIFYVAGFMAKKYNVISRLPVPALLGVGCVSTLICYSPAVLIGFAQMRCDSPLIWYLGTLTGSIFLCGAVYQLYARGVVSRYAEYMGKGSLFIMLVNIPVIFSLQRIIPVSELPVYPKGVFFIVVLAVITGMVYLKNIHPFQYLKQHSTEPKELEKTTK